MTDELLVVRCQLGERVAFAQLVRAWHGPVWTYARRMLDTARADDVTQDVWVAVVRGLPRLHEPDRFPAWLFTIARRAVADRLRAEYARPEEPVDDDGDTPVADEAEALLDRVVLAESVAALPVREREVVLLFHLQDLTLQDCAEICGVPVGTVKSRLARARRLLRDHLTGKGYRP